METAAQRTAALETIRTVEEACEQLRAALAAAGIKLPSLRIDLASCTGDAPRPLLQLGGCNLTTARQLTAALRQKAGQ